MVLEENEGVVDPALKRKKKKKPFDASYLDKLESLEIPKAPTEEANVEDLVKDDCLEDDLDFTKMKRKKKKPVLNMQELEAVLDDPQDSEGDDDLDFNKMKKKRKKKLITLDDLEDFRRQASDGRSGDTEDAGVSELDFDGGDTWIGTERDYTYEELLQRAVAIMREKYPDVVAGEKKKMVLKPPQVLRVGTKKTSFANFLELSRILRRTPQHLQSFILAELGTSGSIDANNHLIIKGRFQQKQIEHILRRYITEYVTCHTCRAPETILEKDTRLHFLRCEKCGSRCSVQSIKSGFQAVTSKRAAMRAKAT